MTPFTLDIFNPRPETLGLFATVLAMVFFRRANDESTLSPSGYLAAGFCFGLAATTHPSFAITSAGLALYAVVLVFRNAARKTAFGAIALGFLPALLVLSWYGVHLPLSLETLAANVGGRAPDYSLFGAAMLSVLDYLMLRLPHSASFSARIYWGLPFWVFSLTLLAILVLMSRDLLRRPRERAAQSNMLLWIFFAMSLINVVIAPSGRVQVYVVASFAAVLLVGARFRGSEDTLVVAAAKVRPA